MVTTPQMLSSSLMYLYMVVKLLSSLLPQLVSSHYVLFCSLNVVWSFQVSDPRKILLPLASILSLRWVGVKYRFHLSSDMSYNNELTQIQTRHSFLLRNNCGRFPAKTTLEHLQSLETCCASLALSTTPLFVIINPVTDVISQAEDVDRSFIVSFFMADNTVLIFEPPVRNSGFKVSPPPSRLFLKSREESSWSATVPRTTVLVHGWRLPIFMSAVSWQLTVSSSFSMMLMNTPSSGPNAYYYWTLTFTTFVDFQVHGALWRWVPTC